MKGILVYRENDIEKNIWFIKNLISNYKKCQIDLILKTSKDFKANDINFVINRSRLSYISSYYEHNGILVFNNFKTTNICNNKYLTFKYFSKLGIEMLNTCLVKDLNDYGSFIKYPAVVKSLNGHGGSEVFLASSKEQVNNINTKYKGNLIIQNFIKDNPGDMRIYLMDGKIYACVLRTSNEDFRCNFSLGGKVSFAEPTKEQVEIANKIYKELNSFYIGIDFIKYKGKWILNEIEDVVGSRMLYSLGLNDVVEDFVSKSIEIIKKHPLGDSNS